MKQFILCSIVASAVLMGNICKGQLLQVGATFTVSSTNYPNIIQHTITPGAAYSSANAPSNSRIMWLEYGDGGFTTEPSTIRLLSNNIINQPLLLVNRLYDTVNDFQRIFVTSNFSATPQTRSAVLTDNDNPMFGGAAVSKIRITPSSYDIRKSDTMCFALTYKLIPTTEKKYFLVFRYNRNTFFPLSSAATPTYTSTISDRINLPITSRQIYNIRNYHGESSTSSNDIAALANSFPLGGSNFTDIFVANINPSQLNGENNMFLTLITKGGLAEGNTANIDAYIIEGNSTSTSFSIKASDVNSCAGMVVNLAHDPNYITQSPVCMQLPKIVRDMKYHIHFQNTGRGPADIVYITAKMPFGMNLSTCRLDRVVYSNHSYTIGSNNDGHELDTTLDQLDNKIIFKLYKTSSTLNNNILKGTDDVYNPSVNPETMGDIYFTVAATVGVPYSLAAQAFIDFHSMVSHLNVWENTVPTNIAASNYSSCCNCDLFNCDTIQKSDSSIIKKPKIRTPN
ncbi:MAG TPA: hypothetical protein PLP23_06980 [Panacibacter sp.]|nr:hypothetical protein [Panacibacter sp.]